MKKLIILLTTLLTIASCILVDDLDKYNTYQSYEFHEPSVYYLSYPLSRWIDESGEVYDVDEGCVFRIYVRGCLVDQKDRMELKNLEYGLTNANVDSKSEKTCFSKFLDHGWLEYIEYDNGRRGIILYNSDESIRVQVMDKGNETWLASLKIVN